jgi:small-conductance mechanosensitive channel
MRFAPWFESLLESAGYPAGDSRRWLAGVIAATAVMALTFAVSWFLAQVVGRLMRRLAARTESEVDDKILDILARPQRRLIHIVGAYLAIGELPLPPTIATVLNGLLVIYGAWLGVRLATQIAITLLLAFGHRVQDEVGKEHFEKDYVPLLSKIIGVIFFLVALIYVLHFFGQNVTSLVAALGIGGAAIGLAAKDTIAHMFAGFVILIDRPFRPGDRIKLASGETGDVLEVGTRSTRIKLLDQNTLVVPNSDLMNQRVVNLTYPAHATQPTLELRVAFGTDIEAAKHLILGVLREVPEVIAEPPPTVLFSAHGDYALQLTLSYVVSQFADAVKVQERVRIAVHRKLAEAGVKIPFPTREIITAATK